MPMWKKLVDYDSVTLACHVVISPSVYPWWPSDLAQRVRLAWKIHCPR
jgi:hypothetical protein